MRLDTTQLNAQNLNPENILNPRGQERAQEQYQGTPAYTDPQVFNEAIAQGKATPGRPGHAQHIGDGQWINWCGFCNGYMVSWGAVTILHEMTMHRLEEHGYQPGPLLP